MGSLALIGTVQGSRRFRVPRLLRLIQVWTNLVRSHSCLGCCISDALAIIRLLVLNIAIRLRNNFIVLIWSIRLIAIIFLFLILSLLIIIWDS